MSPVRYTTPARFSFGSVGESKGTGCTAPQQRLLMETSTFASQSLLPTWLPMPTAQIKCRGTTIKVRKEDPNLEGQILKCTLIIGNFSCYLMANKFNATHGKDSLTTGSCVMVPGLGLHRLPNRQPLSQPHILLEEGFVAIVVMGPQPSGFAYCSVKEHPLYGSQAL